MSKKERKFRYTLLSGGAFLFILGISSGYLLWGRNHVVFYQKRADDPKLALINPLLSCNVSENKEFAEYTPLEKEINTVVAHTDPSGKSSVSVYYRDLESGRWFGVNEDALYSPASLLKVPMMIAYFKEAESNPAVLSKEIYYDGTTVVSNDVEHFKSKEDIRPNQYYTVDQLIASMIEHSDNAATTLLFQNINNNSLVEVMTDIGLRFPETGGTSAGTDDYMTVKSYSYLFRLLYNSTYLSRDMSEKAMELLSYSDFASGIVKGLPTGVKAAQKFGERTIEDTAGNSLGRELHDCGIVYYPEHPYLLCVMTKGNDFDTLSSIIGNVSTAVYKNVTEEYKK
jgi:beta-lactamase class A